MPHYISAFHYDIMLFVECNHHIDKYSDEYSGKTAGTWCSTH